MRAPAKIPGGPPGIPEMVFLSYLLIPLSSIMFPHMSIMCFTAKKVTAFKRTVVLYPLSIMLIWLPCVFLGTVAVSQPKINAATLRAVITLMARPLRANRPAQACGHA